MDFAPAEESHTGPGTASRELADKKWCDGNVYTLADIALGCALGYLAFRFPEIEWRNELPQSCRAFRKLEKRAPFMETAPQETLER